jgi:hypothetical protein
MFALGHKQIFAPQKVMSALPPKADTALFFPLPAGNRTDHLFRQRFPGVFQRPFFEWHRLVADSVMTVSILCAHASVGFAIPRLTSATPPAQITIPRIEIESSRSSKRM